MLIGAGGAATEPLVRMAVDDVSLVGEARRAVLALAERLGFDESARGDVGIAATEAATNLARHARGGVLVAQPLVEGTTSLDVVGLELVATDTGPGMADPARCLEDGFSTGGTAGQGLGAIRRLATAFELDSYPGRGTTLVARFPRVRTGMAPAWRPGPRTTIGAVSVPVHEETVCGDAWVARSGEGRTTVLVVDGLGHGAAAAEAAAAATGVFARVRSDEGPVALLELMHDALRATRGAAIAVARVDTEARQVRFAGIGNITAALVDGAAHRHMVSHNGIAGHQVHRIQEFTYPLAPEALLVMASDGLKTQWRLESYPGLVHRHPSTIAATLWRDYTRGRDDATAVVLRVEA